MPRLKRKSARQGKQTTNSDVIDVDRQDDDQVSQVSQGRPDAIAASDSGKEQRQRKHESNLAFWKDLGYYESHPNHVRRKSGKPASGIAKKHQDYGEVKEKYRLQTNPSSKRVLLLQYPDRSSRNLYYSSKGQKPLEIRLKPKAGLVEVDIPLPTNGQNYDQEKGIEFGSALRKGRLSQRNADHGLAGGLDVGFTRTSTRDEEAVGPDRTRADLLEDFESSIKSGHVMDRFTLGGRIVPFKEGDPIYTVATFTGTTCTWTKLDAIVQLRTQFNHLDALNEDKRRVASSLTRKPEDKAKQDRAEDVNMIIKETADSDRVDKYGGMEETETLLKAMRDEQWQRLQWVDSSDEASYEAYDNVLTYQSPEDTPFLVSEMTNDQYLDAISCPRIDPVTQGKKVTHSLGGPDTLSEDEQASSDEGDGDTTSPGVEEGPDKSSGPQHGQFFETLPRGAIQPDGETERSIEQVCRLICTASARVGTKLELRLRERFKDKSRFAFLDPKDKFYPYFKWRLGRNKAGDGILPEYDYKARSEAKADDGA